MVALELNINIFTAKNMNQTVKGRAAVVLWDRCRERAVVSASETNHAARICGQLVFSDRAFSFCSAEFHACHKPAKVLIAFASFGEKWIANAGVRNDFSSNVRLKAGFLCCEMK